MTTVLDFKKRVKVVVIDYGFNLKKSFKTVVSDYSYDEVLSTCPRHTSLGIFLLFKLFW